MDTSEIKNHILNYLVDNTKSVSIYKLKAAIPNALVDSEKFDQVLFELHINGDIIYTPRGIAIQPKTIDSLIEQVSDKNQRVALRKYFSGKTSDIYSAQEMKQFVKNLLSGRPQLNEDIHRRIFRAYRFTEKSFTSIMNQPVSTYIYLKDTCKKGKQDWRELRFDKTIEEKQREQILRLIKSEGLLIDETTLPFTPSDIAISLLKRKSVSISYKELYEEYNKFIAEQMPLPFGLVVSYQKFKTLLSRRKDIILGRSSYVRYRHFKEVFNRRIIKNLQLNKYRNKYISAEIICRDSSEILELGNILGPYELIDFIKSYPDVCEKHKIQFSNTHFLVFGNGDAIKQLEAILNELTPISGDSLAREYEKRYGLSVNSVKTRLLKEVKHYLHCGIYDLNTKSLTEKQFGKLSSHLKKEWYFVDELEVLFKRHAGKLYENYMSIANLELLGYRQTNAIIYSNKFSSLEECFEKIVWTGNTFHVTDDLWAITQVQTILKRKARKLEIIEYAPQKFIRLSYLKKNGVHKKNIHTFIDAVHSHVEDESYFTLKSLRDHGVTLPLEDLGFSDTFYHSLLKHSKKNQARKVADTYIFRKSKKAATLPDFLEYLISMLRCIDLFDFTELLSDKYGISLNPSYIRSVISGTQMHFDIISEKIFLDYDEYFEEV